MKYESLTCTETAELACILNPRIANDIITDSALLRKHEVPAKTEHSTIASDRESSTKRVSIFEDALSEGLGRLSESDEIQSFLHTISSANHQIDPLTC